MGIDLLDLKFRLEKQLQISLHYHHLMFDRLTTVADVVELLWQRLQGLEYLPEQHAEVLQLAAELDMRILPAHARGLWDTFMGMRRENRMLDDLIAPRYRADYWDALSRDLSCPLPPLQRDPGEIHGHFPPALATQRKLLHFLRAQLFKRLEWTPVPASTDADFGLVKQIRRSLVDVVLGRTGKDPTGRPPPPVSRTDWTREELFDVVRDAITDAFGVDFDEVTPDAELIDHLGMD